MKIKLGQLRKIIKEEVSRLLEGSPEQDWKEFQDLKFTKRIPELYKVVEKAEEAGFSAAELDQIRKKKKARGAMEEFQKQLLARAREKDSSFSLIGLETPAFWNSELSVEQIKNDYLRLKKLEGSFEEKPLEPDEYEASAGVRGQFGTGKKTVHTPTGIEVGPRSYGRDYGVG